MKWIISFLLTFVLISTCFVGLVGAKEQSFRVLIKDGKQETRQLKEKYGVRKDFGERGFTTNITLAQVKALQNNPNISVQLVEQYHTTGKPAKPSTNVRYMPGDQTPWGIETIYNNSVIQATYGGTGIQVAVLDTGVYLNHLDLQGVVIQCNDFSSRKKALILNSCNDDNGHGTHVIGTIAANGGSDQRGIYGVAPEVDIWAYKVLDRNGLGYADDIAYAIRYAADSANGTPLVISMSLGSSASSSLIKDAVDYAVGNGVLLIAAAGNEGYQQNTISYPAVLPNVVAVAALENVIENGTYRVADFSSRGNLATGSDDLIVERDVEVTAPGRAIESTWNDGAYRTISGTSMATPHISGLAAKLWSDHSALSNEQVRTALQDRAKINDILGGYYSTELTDISSGFGLPSVQ